MWLYVNDTIVTVNDAQPKAETVAVKGGRILAVGTRAQVGTSLPRNAMGETSTTWPSRLLVHPSGVPCSLA